mgnify:CR=1 FL=1
MVTTSKSGKRGPTTQEDSGLKYGRPGERIVILKVRCVLFADEAMEQDSMLPMMGAFRSYVRDSLDA